MRCKNKFPFPNPIKKGKKIRKPGSVLGNHLSGPSSKAERTLSDLPEGWEADSLRALLQAPPSCLVLHRMGFTSRFLLPGNAVGSYPAFSLLTPSLRTGRTFLCCTFRFGKARKISPFDSAYPLLVARHPVLWCPDFPPRPEGRSDCPIFFPINRLLKIINAYQLKLLRYKGVNVIQKEVNIIFA
jgi:hypothetical protein